MAPLVRLFTLQPADIMEMTANSLPVGPADVADLPTKKKKTRYRNEMFWSWAMHDQLLLSIVQHGHMFGLMLSLKSNSSSTHSEKWPAATATRCGGVAGKWGSCGERSLIASRRSGGVQQTGSDGHHDDFYPTASQLSINGIHPRCQIPPKLGPVLCSPSQHAQAIPSCSA